MSEAHERSRADGQGGDFRASVAAEVPGLYRYALSVAGDPVEAEDLVSDTVVRALEHREQFRAESSLRTWLHRILHHIAVDHARHTAHEVSVEDVEKLWHDEDYSVDASVVVERAESVEDLRDALVHLPQHYRSVVVLHDAEGWPASEIAELLGISLAATKQRIRRGRMVLVSTLAHGEERRVANKGVPLGCWEARRQVSDYLDDELGGVSSSLGGLYDTDNVVPAELAERIREKTGLR
jgi:RNA polymerase sigma-70 factor (ECF subfamily)